MQMRRRQSWLLALPLCQISDLTQPDFGSTLLLVFATTAAVRIRHHRHRVAVRRRRELVRLPLSLSGQHESLSAAAIASAKLLAVMACARPRSAVMRH